MKVYVINFEGEDFEPVICADEKSAIIELKNLGLSKEEINKAFTEEGVWIPKGADYYRYKVDDCRICVYQEEVIKHS